MATAFTGRLGLARLAVFVAAVAAIAIPVGFAGGEAYSRVDSEWYLRISQGDTAHVMQPFAARQLGPLLVRAMSTVTHASLQHCFFWLGIFSLLTAAAVSGWLLIRRDAGWVALLAVGGTFFWAATFGGFMLPDTLAAALLSVFLLLLWKQQYSWAILLLLPMFVSRESTILVLACLLIAGWKYLSWTQRGLSLLTSAAGMFVVKLLTAHSLANREQINPLLYMVGKVPWNFASNLLAMGPWMPSFTSFCATPRWTMHLHLGAAEVVGLCGWQPSWQPRVILIALCSFGLLPIATLFLLRYHRRVVWADSLFVRFCVVYGGIAFLLAPLLGRTLERLFLYSWPLFLLITPVALMLALRGTSVPWKFLLTLHLATAWVDWLLFKSWEQASVTRAWGLCAAVVGINIVAWVLLRRADSRTALETV